MSGRSILLWLLLALLPESSAIALGLGDIRVESGLNQPLSADIEIVGATHDDLQRVKITVASRDQFLQYGADRPSFLSSLSFRIVEDGAGHATLRVRSAETFTEPFVALLIDVSWPGGKLIRDYTLLLDPPAMDSTAAPATDAEKPAPRVAHAPAAAPPVAADATPDLPVKSRPRHAAVSEAARTSAAQVATEPAPATPRAHRARAAAASHTAPPAIEAAALAALVERVRLLEAALDQTKQAQASEHAELLALREQVTQAATNSRLPGAVESPVPSLAATPAVAVEPVGAEPAAGESPDIEASSAESVPQEPLALQSDGAAVPSASTLTVAREAAGRVPWRLLTLLLAAAGFVYVGMRYLAQRRVTHAARNSLDDVELDVDESDAHPALHDEPEARDHDALWMRPPAPPAPDLPEPPRVALFNDEPTMQAGPPPVDVTAAPEQTSDPGTSYLTAIERELSLDEIDDDGFLDDAITVAARAPEVDDHTEDIATTLDTSGISPDMLILEPDFTSTDMELTSRRYDHAPGTTERRSDATDALKDALRFAIEREPDRVDLRIKLLEVYYATAVANHLAFFDLASALSRERDHVPPEELERIHAMQRAIAAGPARTTEAPGAQDLANCA